MRGFKRRSSGGARAPHRCGGVAWGDAGLALLYESWYKTRRSVVWAFAPGDPAQPKRVLFDRNYEDAYTDPGSPASRRTGRGTYVLVRLEGTGELIMQGASSAAREAWHCSFRTQDARGDCTCAGIADSKSHFR